MPFPRIHRQLLTWLKDAWKVVEDQLTSATNAVTFTLCVGSNFVIICVVNQAKCESKAELSYCEVKINKTKMV